MIWSMKGDLSTIASSIPSGLYFSVAGDQQALEAPQYVEEIILRHIAHIARVSQPLRTVAAVASGFFQ